MNIVSALIGSIVGYSIGRVLGDLLYRYNLCKDKDKQKDNDVEE